ncbi:MAG: Nif3-like dinuclear metal center hexameric protein [Sulfurovum sp.]|nr:Nif3-like dinuclear metal center hexameric protein [Sulfurovum sp.]
MTLKQIHRHLNTLSPFALQEKWDNSGLIVGELNREVSQIVLSLDIDEALIEKAEENTLFIVHHPLIFGKLTQLDFAKYPANLIEKLILKKHSLIAMHTNFDKTHLNSYVFEKVLGFKIERQDAFICVAKVDFTYKNLLKHLKDKFNLPTLKVVGKKEKVTSIALCTGAGASLIDEVEADCFLTGDIKYHDAMKAMSEDLMMVDIGHYESEVFFAEILFKELKVLPILVIMSNSQNPFYNEML